MSHLGQNLIPKFVLEKHRKGLFSGQFKAATLFVDISGFTTLTEAFLTHHREGAEALTNALHQIFVPQIEILYGRGGFIPYFAGDAFIAIFPYDDDDFGQENAAQQAIKTAVNIQAHVCQTGIERLIETPNGTFGFGITIGLAFGNIDWGIPSHSNQHTFYFRGDAINGCADAQKQAQTGQIILDHTIAHQFQTYLETVPIKQTPFSRLLRETLPELPKQAEQPASPAYALTPFLPEQIIHLQVNEFREVSTIFISFEAPSETEKFHAFIGEVMQLLKQFGGYLNQVDVGDKGSMLVILFGAPVAYENNLLRAAGFLQKMYEHDFGLRWRAGMTFGLLWTGIRGGGERCEYGVVGNEINLAARLATKAEWGQIWVSDVVYRELKDAYLFYSLGNFPIKGKAEQIPIYRFFYRYDSIEFHDFQGELVGRESDIKLLEQVAQTVFQEKQAKLVYINGDVGVGKTRLVFELRRKILYKYFPQTFYCPADEIQQTSLNPFKRFLRTYFGLKPDFSVEDNKEAFDQQFDFLLSQLGLDSDEVVELANELLRTRSILGAMVDLYWEGSLYETLDPKLRFENTLDAFKNLIKAATLVRPVILHLEDAQWLDKDSEKMVQALSLGLPDRALLIICSCRYLSDGTVVQFKLPSGFGVEHIHLNQLSLEQVQKMTSAYLNTAVSPAVAQFLIDKTDGNPFFIEQLLEDLRERNAFATSDDGSIIEIIHKTIKIEDIPTSLNTLLLARLDRLDYQVKNIVRAASVLGNQFQLPVLHEMLKYPPNFEQLVSIAESEQILVSNNRVTYQFKHALLRDASYAMQLKSKIKEQHRLAGTAIETIYFSDVSSHFSELAFHAHRGEQADLAIKWYQLAGEKAASHYANSEALTYLDSALALNQGIDVEREIALRLIREKIFSIQGMREEQKEELNRLSALILSHEDLEKQTAVSHRLARYAEDTGDYSTALKHASNTIQLANQSLDTIHLVAAHLLQGKVYFRQSDYEQAYYWLKEGLAQAQINNLQTYEADSLRQIGIVLVDESQFEEAERYYKEALALYDALGHKSGLATTFNNLGVLKMNAGNLMQAQEYYNKSLSLYKEIGYRRGENLALMNLGMLVAAYGDYERSKAYYEQALKSLTEINERFGICIVMLNLTDVLLYQSDFELAHEYGRNVYALAKEIGAKRIYGMALTKIGVALRGRNKLVGAEKAFNDAIDLWHKMNQPDLEMEARIGLALLYLNKNATYAAREQGLMVLAYLQANDHRLDKVHEVVPLLFNTYLVLTAVNDPNALPIIEKAFALLQKNAHKINQPSLKTRLLNDVPIHREIVSAYQYEIEVHQ